jgi:hypothetical protein
VKAKILICGIRRRRRSFVASPLEGIVLKPLILFTHSDGLDIHGIDVGRRPTGDVGVLSGG